MKTIQGFILGAAIGYVALGTYYALIESDNYFSRTATAFILFGFYAIMKQIENSCKK
jgi:multisubunit Na+/H+ antiporter MnhE subunit